MEIVQETIKKKKRRVWGRCVVFFRWVFIVLFAAILLAGLYFKAPWKVLALDAILLALLTVVPKSYRKYGRLTLAAAILAVTVWIFIPGKDTDDWKPYTFNEELAVLEAQRAVPVETNAAPLYEALFERWKEIEESDPFPKEADDDCNGTLDRPWTTDEFPEIAAWFDRHHAFFQDVITASQKPACYFPGAVTVWELSESMDRLSPVKHFAQHLIRASYLDIGENKDVFSAYQKQLAVLKLGKHVNQQPLMIDMLVGVAIEAMAYDILTRTMIQQPFPEDITVGDFLAMMVPIQTSHFDHQEKWKQIVAYEKLLAKNTYGMMYEINSEGKIRSSHFKSVMNTIQDLCPDEELAELSNSYWRDVSFKISKFFLWFSGQPNDPKVLSTWVDEAYRALEEAVQNENCTSEIDSDVYTPFELNYKYTIKRITQIPLSSFKKIQGDIIPRVCTQKSGTEIVFDLVLYKMQHGQYPDALDALGSSDNEKQAALEQYAGFVYHKTDDDFKLYHVGINNIDEKGKYEMPEWDPNDFSLEERKPITDDILIWPDKLEGGN